MAATWARAKPSGATSSSVYEQSHHVVCLPVHLPNQQNITFSNNSDLWETLQKPQTSQLLQCSAVLS